MLNQDSNYSSNNDRGKENLNVGIDDNDQAMHTQTMKSLLKFQQHDPSTGIHDKIGEMLSSKVDEIAVERELEMEDEDTLIERKKQELKKWFMHNYQHELNQKLHLHQMSNSSAVGANNAAGASNADLSF